MVERRVGREEQTRQEDRERTATRDPAGELHDERDARGGEQKAQQRPGPHQIQAELRERREQDHPERIGVALDPFARVPDEPASVCEVRRVPESDVGVIDQQVVALAQGPPPEEGEQTDRRRGEREPNHPLTTRGEEHSGQEARGDPAATDAYQSGDRAATPFRAPVANVRRCIQDGHARAVRQTRRS